MIRICGSWPTFLSFDQHMMLSKDIEQPITPYFEFKSLNVQDEFPSTYFGLLSANTMNLGNDLLLFNERPERPLLPLIECLTSTPEKTAYGLYRDPYGSFLSNS